MIQCSCCERRSRKSTGPCACAESGCYRCLLREAHCGCLPIPLLVPAGTEWYRIPLIPYQNIIRYGEQKASSRFSVPSLRHYPQAVKKTAGL